MNTKRRLATLLLATLVFTFGAAACGVQEGQEGQEEVEKARKAQKQLEEKQQQLEEKLQESQ